MKLKINHYFIIFMLLAVTSAFSQKVAVRGKIVDTEGQPLFGVNVVEVDESDRFLNGTISDFNGDFVLEVGSANAKLKFKYIGYKEQIISVKGKGFLSVKMASDVQVLTGVDVVAARVAQNQGITPVSKRDLSDSRVIVSLENMQELGASSADELLQGNVSGLDIVMNSGDPGSGSSLVIRGMGSLGGAQPLIVVDDVPQDIKAGSDFNFASADVEDIGSLVSIPPSDIADVQVLKDASATAMYGSQGANGVILIITKRGSKSKPIFDFTYKLNYDRQPASIPLLNGDEYVTLQLEELFNPTGLYALPIELAYERTYKDYYNYAQNTNWLDQITQNPMNPEYNFSVRGGGDKATYFITLNSNTEEGTTRNTSLNRLATRINLDYKISDKLRMSANFSYTNNDNDKAPVWDLKDEVSGKIVKMKTAREMSYIKAPNMSVWEYDPYGNLSGSYFSPITSYQSTNGLDYYNPVALTDLAKMNITENQINATLDATYNVLKGLTFKGTLSYVYLTSTLSAFLPTEAVGLSWTDVNNNSADQGVTESTQFRGVGQLTYRKDIDANNNFVANGGFEVKESQSTSSVHQVGQTPSANLNDPASEAIIYSMNDGIGIGRSLRFTSFLQYKHKDRYSITLNGSLEGSTKFGADKRWALFPSVAGFWRFGDEPWARKWAWMGKEAKLKASFGFSGNANDISNYGRHATYKTDGYYIENLSVIPAQVQLDNMQWEISEQTNVGIELPLFQDKLFLSIEGYNKRTKDLMWKDYAIPTSSGYDQIAVFNGGDMTNRGIEMSASGTVLKWGPKKKNTLSLNANVSKNINMLNSAPANFVNVRDGSLVNGKYPRIVNTGVPIGSFYGVEYLGVYPTSNISGNDPINVNTPVARDAEGNVMYDFVGKPLRMRYVNGGVVSPFYGGDAIYKDQNYDGQIDVLDAVNLGNSNPDLIGGFGSSLKIQQFQISLQFFGRYGQDIVNSVAQSTQGMNNKNNASKAVLRRWRWEGMDQPDMLPRAYMNDQKNNLGSSRFVEDGSFLRLNNVSVKYDLPAELCSKMHVKKLAITGSVRRLFVITSYTGQDPEVSIGNDFFWMGTDNAKTPPAQRFTLTFNVNF